ncbi:MAG: lysylphosphatidylglycerol synthase transmembrane domain-containing protein [Myxococcales bacterium]|jgi:uncharacterized membrane protein YbhN (UPF0104 family)
MAQPLPPKPRPAWRRALPLLGLVLLVWVLSRLDLGAMAAALAEVSWGAVGLGAGLFAVNLGIKILRWGRMLAVQGLRVPPAVVVAAFLSGAFYGQVTLGRLGEMVRAEALTERGVPLGQALSSCLYDRGLDVGLVLLLGASLGALVIGDARAAWLAAAVVLALALMALAVVRAPALGSAPWVMRLRERMARVSLLARGLSVLDDLVAGIGVLLRPGFLLEAGLVTAVAWTGYFGALVVLAAGLGIEAPPVLLVAGASLAALSALLPVTVSGLGARELIYAQVLSLAEVPPERAVLLSLLHLAMMTAVAIGLGALGVAARHRQRLA